MNVSCTSSGAMLAAYLWTLPAFTAVAAAFALGQADRASLPRSGRFAIDLGAGFGMHTVPLARAGWRVLAIDSSPTLLSQRSEFIEGLAVNARCGELLGFSEYVPPAERADLVLCMGETLTHLETPDAISELGRAVDRTSQRPLRALCAATHVER